MGSIIRVVGKTENPHNLISIMAYLQNCKNRQQADCKVPSPLRRVRVEGDVVFIIPKVLYVPYCSPVRQRRSTSISQRWKGKDFPNPLCSSGNIGTPFSRYSGRCKRAGVSAQWLGQCNDFQALDIGHFAQQVAWRCRADGPNGTIAQREMALADVPTAKTGGYSSQLVFGLCNRILFAKRASDAVFPITECSYAEKSMIVLENGVVGAHQSIRNVFFAEDKLVGCSPLPVSGVVFAVPSIGVVVDSTSCPAERTELTVTIRRRLSGVWPRSKNGEVSVYTDQSGPPSAVLLRGHLLESRIEDRQIIRIGTVRGHGARRIPRKEVRCTAGERRTIQRRSTDTAPPCWTLHIRNRTERFSHVIVCRQNVPAAAVSVLRAND